MTKTIEQIQGMNIPVGTLINVEAKGKDTNGNYTGQLDSYVGYNVGLKIKAPYSDIHLFLTPSKSLSHEVAKNMQIVRSSIPVQDILPHDIEKITVMDEDGK